MSRMFSHDYKYKGSKYVKILADANIMTDTQYKVFEFFLVFRQIVRKSGSTGHGIESDFLIKIPAIKRITRVTIDISNLYCEIIISCGKLLVKVAKVAPELIDSIVEEGCRFSHHSSIAPTGTISLSLANNVSNGIEPSFAHHYSRNVIREGKKSKEKVDVFSYELLAYRTLVNPKAMPFGTDESEALPDYFVSSENIVPKAHVDIQAAAQKWVDSSISKTINVPTECEYEEFKDIYLYAAEKGLKGCTTFRFNPEAFQGVLVKESDLENTTYSFTLEDGSTVEFKGNEEVEYDGETHTAANLFDALKEGYYGKF